MRRKAARRRARGALEAEIGKEPATFGDLVTADHITLLDEGQYSRVGDTACCVIQDAATMYINAYPAPTKDADDTIKALQH